MHTLAPELIHGISVIPVVMPDGVSATANDCANCFFEADHCDDIQCADYERDDGNEVYFVCGPKINLPPASDGSTASYYELPANATELQDLIAYRNMNSQMGEIGRAWYRYGQCPHSPKLRELKKMKFYVEAEIARLEKYGEDE